MIRNTLLALLMVAMPLRADLAITGDTEVKPQHSVSLKLTGAAPKSGITWIVKPIDGQDRKEIEYLNKRSGDCLKFIGPLGRYEVTAITGVVDAAGAFTLETVDVTVTIGQPVPPTPPTPPTPPVPPVPPVPPQPPAPIPTAGLHVLIVYDAKAKGKMTPDQAAVLTGKDVRDYLNSKCATDADGSTKAYRIWDASTDPSGDDKVWSDAFARKRESLPWIVISNGKTGFEGPLPADPAATISLLQKYEVK